MLRKDDISFEYAVIFSDRAKRIRIDIKWNGLVKLIIPNFYDEETGLKFLKEKEGVILKKLEELREKVNNKSWEEENLKILEHKQRAREKIEKRVKYFAEKYGFQFNKIKVKDNKTNWGSCSQKKNLNFNYRLLFLDDDIFDYVIIHELCHLREMNHSEKFWKEVGKILPDYKERRRKLKKVRF